MARRISSGLPVTRSKMFLWRRGRRQEVLDRNRAIRESANMTPWPPRPTYASGPARQAEPLAKVPTPHERIMTRIVGFLTA